MYTPRINSLDLRSYEGQHIAWDWPYPAPCGAYSATDIIKLESEHVDAIFKAMMFGTEPWRPHRRRPMRQWHWHRIFIAIGTILLAGQAAWLLAVAWL